MNIITPLLETYRNAVAYLWTHAYKGQLDGSDRFINIRSDLFASLVLYHLPSEQQIYGGVIESIVMVPRNQQRPDDVLLCNTERGRWTPEPDARLTAHFWHFFDWNEAERPFEYCEGKIISADDPLRIGQRVIMRFRAIEFLTAVDLRTE